MQVDQFDTVQEILCIFGMPRSRIMKQQSVRCLAWLMGRGRPTTPVRLATLMWRIEMEIVVSLLLVSHVPGEA